MTGTIEEKTIEGQQEAKQLMKSLKTTVGIRAASTGALAYIAATVDEPIIRFASLALAIFAGGGLYTARHDTKFTLAINRLTDSLDIYNSGTDKKGLPLSDKSKLVLEQDIMKSVHTLMEQDVFSRGEVDYLLYDKLGVLYHERTKEIEDKLLARDYEALRKHYKKHAAKHARQVRKALGKGYTVKPAELKLNINEDRQLCDIQAAVDFNSDYFGYAIDEDNQEVRKELSIDCVDETSITYDIENEAQKHTVVSAALGEMAYGVFDMFPAKVATRGKQYFSDITISMKDKKEAETEYANYIGQKNFKSFVARNAALRAETKDRAW
ncbi:MAG: hypothetical protein FWE53_02495 [Firmicutes bacterium]|nr:hypothetical protein [Bacillota bacterium]